MSLLSSFLIILLGYLLGSISPSYILGRVLKKIDIRQIGTRNAGTVNAYRMLGLWPALITGIFDCAKGLFAMHVAKLSGFSPTLVYSAGFAAIGGHVFPFYLGFRGGQGVATATGMLLYYLFLFLKNAWLPLDSLLLLAFCVLSFTLISKKGEIVGSVVLPILGIFILVLSPPQSYRVHILIIIAYILLINVINIRKEKILQLSSPQAKKEINWRLYLRPFAVILLINYLSSDKKDTLTLIGVIALLFLTLDLARLLSRRVNVFFFDKLRSIYKEKEYKKFSSITIFLFACFITVLIFEKEIALLAVSYLIFGDFFSKFFGIQFGRRKLFEKTLEGSLAHFNGCLISGYLFCSLISFPLPIHLLGALVASLSEALPLNVNDNFSVPLLSASSMYVFHLF